MNIRERLGKELLFLDGGMGTLLQAEGLAPGELPRPGTSNIRKRWKRFTADITKQEVMWFLQIPLALMSANFMMTDIRLKKDPCRDCKCKKSRGADWKRDLCGTGYGTDRKAIKTNGRSGF